MDIGDFLKFSLLSNMGGGGRDLTIMHILPLILMKFFDEFVKYLPLLVEAGKQVSLKYFSKKFKDCGKQIRMKTIFDEAVKLGMKHEVSSVSMVREYTSNKDNQEAL